jgi:hypothetical protein
MGPKVKYGNGGGIMGDFPFRLVRPLPHMPDSRLQ